MRSGRQTAYLASKRALDLVISLAILPFAIVLGCVCVAAIMVESPGAAAIFSQQRTGQHGTRFLMFKFRTMVPNAEELKAQLMHLNILPPPDFKILDDPRVTRVGKILRKTSLDELPQLVNVLRGEMSLVGPRPTSFDSSTYSLWHTERLEVKPGITGLWQITARNESTFDERLRLDIRYVRNMSLARDALILTLTLAAVVKRSGA